jgi:hypothetical protein
MERGDIGMSRQIFPADFDWNDNKDTRDVTRGSERDEPPVLAAPALRDG